MNSSLRPPTSRSSPPEDVQIEMRREIGRNSCTDHWPFLSIYGPLHANNCLLLAANVDLLFDNGLPPFSGNGTLLISPAADVSPSLPDGSAGRRCMQRQRVYAQNRRHAEPQYELRKKLLVWLNIIRKNDWLDAAIRPKMPHITVDSSGSSARKSTQGSSATRDHWRPKAAPDCPF